MNKTISDSTAFLEELALHLPENGATVGLAVPYTLIKTAIDQCRGSPKLASVLIGAQNMNDASKGAFTGEIAAQMLIDVGAQFVLLGHSERRKYFGETDSFINSKVLKAANDQFPFILCIGETLDEREASKTKEVLALQLKNALEGISEEGKVLVTIAYEPVWAIGTGVTPTLEEIEETCLFIHEELDKLGIKRQVLYGGSVSSKNVAQLSTLPSINGFLVGGASLEPQEFIKIIGAKKSQ